MLVGIFVEMIWPIIRGSSTCLSHVDISKWHLSEAMRMSWGDKIEPTLQQYHCIKKLESKQNHGRVAKSADADFWCSASLLKTTVLYAYNEAR